MTSTIFETGWTYFMDAWRFVERGGRWSADTMHLELIEAVLATLPTEIAATVRQQLEHRYFFSWMSDGRINVFFFYNQRGLTLIPDPAYEDRLFKVELFVEGRKYVAHVSFFERRIHCVELKKPRSFFKGKAYRIGAVSDGKPTDSFTRAIDRVDHGKPTDINP